MDKRVSENGESRPILQHYIAKQNTVLNRISGSCNANISTLRLGMLVEAVEIQRDGGLRIRVNDPNGSDIWRRTEWLCHRYDLIPVLPIIWQYLLAVPVPQERVRLASNKQFCEEIKDICLNDKVWYTPDPGASAKFLSIVKYIGPVAELGQGIYFGLDVLDNREVSKTSKLAQQYFSYIRSSGVFATLSNVEPFKAEGAESGEVFRNNEVVSHKHIIDFSNEDISYSTDRTPQDSSVAYMDRLSLFDDKTNNNRNTPPVSKEPAASKSSYQSANSSNIIGDASSLSRNADSYTVFDTEHKWSSDIDLNTYSNLEVNHDSLSPNHNSVSKNDDGISVRPENTGDLRVGSTVKVLVDTDTRQGVIRWIGTPPGTTPGKLMAAVELDEGHPLGTDGTYNDIRYFHCMPRRAIFTDMNECHQGDKMPVNERAMINVNNFGNMESSVVMGMIRPICVKGDLESICGKYRGIQGHHNSCYLDATLFSMFAFTSVFDNLLFRPPNEKDCPQYEEVQRVLREEIVNPLRRNMFVRADRVMKLRTLLEKLSSISGLTSEEKDPEEFLTSLVAQILNAEPFLKLSSGQDAYHYQLFVEKDDHLNLPTVQQLLEQSFLTSNIRLKEVPSCLIIQMPRFGKSFKMYPKIQPTLLLDVTDIIEDSPRQCTVCGKLADFECKECYGQCGVGLESIAFCLQCLEKVHRHERRTNHEPKKLIVPMEFAILQEHCPVPRLYLELSAVVCIETSHYVSFVKCGSGSEAPWCFFDSMADRKGEQNGYNIPEMVPCPDFPYWLSEEGINYLTELTDDRHLPEHAKRLLCDAYMCMYQSPDVMMYK